MARSDGGFVAKADGEAVPHGVRFGAIYSCGLANRLDIKREIEFRSMRAKYSEGIWIFVSHSMRDLEEVRRVRNELERRGHHPLLFYLRSVTDTEELSNLIRREIKARKWFVLCKSANAHNSIWVRQELDVIASLPDKVVIEIDLTSSWEEQVRQIDQFVHWFELLVLGLKHGEKLAVEIEREIIYDEYTVSYPDEFASQIDWKDKIAQNIQRAVAHGTVLTILSEELLLHENSMRLKEIEYALECARHTSHAGLIFGVGDNRPEVLSLLTRSRIGQNILMHQIIDLTKRNELLRMLFEIRRRFANRQ